MYRLARNIQVRKENWGLLFYSQTRHRAVFVRSGDWLYPHHFDGTWEHGILVANITARKGTKTGTIELPLKKLTDTLLKSGIITNGLC